MAIFKVVLERKANKISTFQINRKSTLKNKSQVMKKVKSALSPLEIYQMITF